MALGWASPSALGQPAAPKVCPRPPAGSVVPEPEDLRSKNGVLEVDVTYRNHVDANGQMLYCYQYKDGSQAPTLRLHPGDWLVLRLRNDLKPPAGSAAHDHSAMSMPTAANRCGDGTMGPWATNLHFHGLTLPPVCHEDDVLNTYIAPGGKPFEYRLQIPADEPPGLYWYHPHVHGYTNAQVQGGASGALIVEGIERANLQLGGMPERVFVVRDQELLHPDAQPATASAVPPPPVVFDPEGDVLNTRSGGGKPAKDLSINFVPVPYPDYPAALITMKPGAKELWRVLNASAVTYLGLEVLFNGQPEPVAVVSMDGVPLNKYDPAVNHVRWATHLDVPPGGRVEFALKGPAEGVQAQLITRFVDTGAAGENDPDRPLATIMATAKAPDAPSVLPASPSTPMPRTSTWLGDVQPVRERKLYFSESPSDPKDPKSPTVFMLTVEGQKPVPYDPTSTIPNIIAHQGDVEDWIIENRTPELHAFHTHQLHFLLLQSNGAPVNEPYLRDTVSVDYWSGQGAYPSVKLRMDFRDPTIIGTFVYHCHLLDHEDGGMMGTIRIDPASSRR
jgi:FtsP/CotA-like multicopper oxidase with cupredoxin domain